MELVKVTNNILNEYSKIADIKWFIMDGSLLGAYRNNKMVAHDYDFDFGLYCSKDEPDQEDLLWMNSFIEDDTQERDTKFK